MSVERVLVVALAVASTLAAGLAADARARSSIRAGRLALVTVANIVALPLTAYVLARVASVDAVGGLVLAAAAPGGSTGPLLALLGRGDAPTAAIAFLVLTLAGMVAALIATMALDVAGVATVAVASLVVVVTSVGPLLAGVAIRARRPAIAVAWQPWLSRLSLALLVATIAVLAVRHGDAARAESIIVGAVVTLVALCIGLLVDGRAARVAVAQVSAVRNLTLVLLVLAVVGAPPADTMAVLAYGLAMYVVTLAAAFGWRSGMTRT
jgi:BASS family bile acid:Na+ symporter